MRRPDTKKGKIGEHYFNEVMMGHNMIADATNRDQDIIRRIPDRDGGRDFEREGEYFEIKTGPTAKLSNKQIEFRDAALERGEQYNEIRIPGNIDAFRRRRGMH